jgi:zinc protease
MNSISKNITEITYSRGERVFIAPTSAKDVVTIMGSVLGGPNFFPKNKSVVAGLGAELLDTGTKKYNKENLRNILSDLGATLSFSSGGDRTYFSGSCLPEDLPTVLSVAFECLSAAIFAPQELALLKERVLGELVEEKSDTRTQANMAFGRSIWSAESTNYGATTNEKITQVKKVTQKDLLQYGSLLGRGGLVLCVVGDVTVLHTKKAVEDALKTLPEGTQSEPEKIENTKKPTANTQIISITEKANIDVFMGCAIPFTQNDPLYLPFIVLSSMLGGRGLSTGHLMRTIRERDGLTYGIYGGGVGFDTMTTGALRIWATFSPATYEKAVEQTKKEIAFFLKKGITASSLSDKKMQIAGSHVVELSTTGGLASTLHKIGIDGKPLTYIDEYLTLIEKVTIKDLEQVAKFITLDKFSLASAGTFDAK